MGNLSKTHAEINQEVPLNENSHGCENITCLICFKVPTIYLDNNGQDKVKSRYYYCSNHYLEMITTDWDDLITDWDDSYILPGATEATLEEYKGITVKLLERVFYMEKQINIMEKYVNEIHRILSLVYPKHRD